MPYDDLTCASAPPLGGALGSWADVKRLLLEAAASTKEALLEVGRRQEEILNVIYDEAREAQCRLGHYALRMALYLLLEARSREEHLRGEPSPFALGLTVVQILTSGWPIFGLLGLLAYRLQRDGMVPPVAFAGGPMGCSEQIESFRIRYVPVTFQNEDVQFSRDVERHVLEDLWQGGAVGAGVVTNASSHRCWIGAALPLLGHAASLQCFARRDPRLHRRLQDTLLAAHDKYLQRASTLGWAAAESQPDGASTAMALLRGGFWAAEAFALLQRSAAAFAESPRPPLGGREPDAGSDVVLSIDPHEGRFYGRGLRGLLSHVWGDAVGFKIREALPCADALVVRDSLPSQPFPGGLVYVDHEAGLGPGRDAGRLDVVLQKHRLVYLGVLEPLAETRCLSRSGRAAAQSSRVCAKVFSGRSSSPSIPVAWDEGPLEGLSPGAPAIHVVHVPLASTSFLGRHRHSPLHLEREPRPYEVKPKFLGYMAYTCVDHREQLFDLLVRAAARHDLGAADALSRCAGDLSRHRRLRNHTRNDEEAFLDEAVELLRPYRFALVFENKLVPGYVTEKIVNAFLAGSIPIYWGSRVVLDIFSPAAFIYANDLQGQRSDYASPDPLTGLDRVVAEVVRVAQSPEDLHRMATAPVLSEAQLRQYFSWHRGVRASLGDAGGQVTLQQRLSEALLRALGPRQRLVLCEGTGRLCTAPY